MNAKITKKTAKSNCHPLGKNNELQIPNKQHIKNKGIDIIASPHSKPQIYSWVAICQSGAVSHSPKHA